MTDLFGDTITDEPLNAKLDLRLEYLKERYGLPDDWRWCSFEGIGDFDPKFGYDHALYRGGVYSSVYQRGPRKGRTNYGKPDHGTERSLVISCAEFDAWLPAWEARTGWCWKCKGSGQQWMGWNRDTGNKYRDCPRCAATGDAPADLARSEAAAVGGGQ